MDFLFSGLFWGVLLIVIGIIVIIKIVFKIEIPVIRIAFALILIFLGIRVLLGHGTFSQKKESNILFGESRFEDDGREEYNVVFGKGIFDLSRTAVGGTRTIKYSTVFGASVIILDPDTPLIVRADSAFAGASFPDGSTVAFGSYTYRSRTYDESKPHLVLKADVVFGGLEIRNK